MSAVVIENLGAIQPNLEKCSIRQQTSFPSCALLNLFTITSAYRSRFVGLSTSCSRFSKKFPGISQKVAQKNQKFFGSDDKI